MALDRETRMELAEVIGNAIAAAKQAQNERYVTGKRLCEMFQMFTPSRLKTWGETLPRIRATFISEDGESEQTGWAYNVAEIQKMIDRNELVFTMKPKDHEESGCQYRASNASKKYRGSCIARNGQ